jgi:hypothetical protein
VLTRWGKDEWEKTEDSRYTGDDVGPEISVSFGGQKANEVGREMKAEKGPGGLYLSGTRINRTAFS